MDGMTEFHLHIVSGKVSNIKVLANQLATLCDGRYKVRIDTARKRTLEQNAWFHAILPDILQGLRDAGYNEVITVKHAKYVVKALFFKKTISNGIEDIEIIEDTSDTSKLDFAERAFNIIQWAKEYLNLDIAPPLKQTEFFQQ